LLLGVLAACESPDPRPQGEEVVAVPAVRQVTGEALGTTWTVKYFGGPATEDQVGEAVREALASVDQAMSTWRDDSELARIRQAGGAVVVSEATAEVIGEALELAAATEGAFDPTVQPLVEVWGIHGGRRQDLPSPEELARARAQVGWDRVVLGRDTDGR